MSCDMLRSIAGLILFVDTQLVTTGRGSTHGPFNPPSSDRSTPFWEVHSPFLVCKLVQLGVYVSGAALAFRVSERRTHKAAQFTVLDPGLYTSYPLYLPSCNMLPNHLLDPCPLPFFPSHFLLTMRYPPTG